MMGKCLSLAVLAMALASNPAGGAQPPGADLSLHLIFDGQIKPGIGPEASRTAAGKDAFVTVDGRTCVDLAKASASWAMGPVINTAQGAVSFHTRAKGPKAGDVFRLRITRTGGGEWSLNVTSGPYKRDPKAKSQPATPSVAVVEVLVQARPFAEGDITQNLRGSVGDDQAEQWHHVVYTWRSVWHSVYIDGKLVRTEEFVSRLQPPGSSEGVFEILQGGGLLSDLRVYRRALDAADVAALAPLKADQQLPALPPMRVWADWGTGTGRAVVYADTAAVPQADRVEFACVKKGSAAPAPATISSLPAGLGETVAALTKGEALGEGAYSIQAIAYDKAGKELARAASAEIAVPKNDLPWLGSRAGLDKKNLVLPPYTPMEVGGDVIATSMRKHTLDRSGLFKSIVAAGGELLAAPVTVDVKVGGKALAFGGGSGLGKIDARPDSVSWSAVTESPEGYALRVDGYMEYDGVTRFDVTLTPRGELSLDELTLRVPYRPEVFRLIHSIASGFIHRFMSVHKDPGGAVSAQHISWSVGAPKEPKRRPGVVFDSDDLHDQATRYKLTGMVHVGNFERGLCWFTDNDRGWVHDYKKVPPMEVYAQGDQAYLQLNVVAKPTVLNGPVSFRFYLLANPFKSLPTDWRTWSYGSNRGGDELTKSSKHVWWWHWNEYADSFQPYPGSGDPLKPPDANKPAAGGGGGAHALANKKTYKDWIGKFKNTDVKHCPFINFGVPAGSGLYDDPYAVETHTLPLSWKCHTNRLLQDYMVYWLDRCAEDIGIAGVYVDEPYGDMVSFNVLATDAAYIRPDGTREMGYDFMEGRSYFRRIRQMFTDRGIDYSLWVHTSSWKALPMLTFVDVSMDGEWPAIWVPSFVDYHGFYDPQKSRGYLSGIPFGFVGTQMLNANFNPKTMPEQWQCARTYLAVSLPYEVLPYQTNAPDELFRVNNIRHRFGVGEAGVRELRFDRTAEWLGGASLEPSGMRVSGQLNPDRHEALLYASCAEGRQTRFELPGGFDGLKLGKYHQAWNAENGVSLNVGGKTVIETAPMDLRTILVRGSDAPQAPRPEGAILGVSFDTGIAPTFGGGIVEAGSGAMAVEQVAGRDGKAASLGFDQGAIGYPVIPSWVAGTAEFDINVAAFGGSPFRVLGLRHWLDVDLSLAGRNGKTGLLLAPHDTQEKATARSAGLGEADLLFVPLADEGQWHRVALSWQAGQYRLYVDGKLAGTLGKPAVPRLQDSAALAAGVLVGDDVSKKPDATTKLAVDSLVLYDWAFGDAEAAEGVGRKGIMAATRPAPAGTFDLWTWGEMPSDIVAGVFLAGMKGWQTVTKVDFSIVSGDAAKPLLVASKTPWFGWAMAPLAPPGSKVPTKPATAGPAMRKTYDAPTLLIELYAGKDVLLTREIPADALKLDGTMVIVK